MTSCCTPPEVDLDALIHSGHIDTIMVGFPDQHGRLMGKRLTAKYFLELDPEHGVHACNYLLTADLDLNPLPGFELASWEQGYGDFVLRPDPVTLKPLPWHPGSALLLCDLAHEDGTPVEQSPRQILRRQVLACREQGFGVQMASELEFYLFQGSYDELAAGGFRDLAPSTPYRIDYHLMGTDRDEALLREARNAMNEAGIVVEGSKGEWDRGQHEMNLGHSSPIEMADRHLIFKEGLKTIAGRHGRAATFMAKVDQAMAGSSCHIHVSLQGEDGRNAFWDEANDRPARRFEHFLAGCLTHARHLALFAAPNVNSYKRYQATSFAPVSVAWGRDNRTCGFRVVGHGQSYRLESRIPGADANPYLAFAALLAAGLDGIARELEPPPEARGNAYASPETARVPGSLGEAIHCLAEGEFARSALGDAAVSHYLRLAELELATHQSAVTDWELLRYFERG